MRGIAEQGVPIGKLLSYSKEIRRLYSQNGSSARRAINASLEGVRRNFLIVSADREVRVWDRDGGEDLAFVLRSLMDPTSLSVVVVDLQASLGSSEFGIASTFAGPPR
jgi:hypothetical protein